MARERSKLLVLETWDLDAEQVAELHEHLVHRSVPGALADAVHAGGEDFGARTKRHNRVPRAETEVVVEVDDQRCVRRRGLDRGNGLTHRKGAEATDCGRSQGPRTPRFEAFAGARGAVMHGRGVCVV